MNIGGNGLKKKLLEKFEKPFVISFESESICGVSVILKTKQQNLYKSIFSCKNKFTKSTYKTFSQKKYFEFGYQN
jgi:hypothetical protein